MGTWGPGIFDNDTAADHIYTFTNKMIETIEEVVASPITLEADEYWGNAMPGHVEMLLSLHRDFYGQLPTLTQAQHWFDTLMSSWEASIDGLGPSDSFKDARRAALAELFGRLIAACEKVEKEDAGY